MSKNSLEDFASYHTKKSKPSKPQHSSHRNDPQPSSPQYSDLDREKLEILKQHNLTLINNLFPSTRPPMGTDRSKSSILEDEAQSIRSESESQYSSNHDSRGQSQQPNSHQSLSTNKYWTPSLGPILSRSNQVDEETSAKRGGLMSFRGGSPGDAVSNSTLRTLSKTVGVEKFVQESYFEYSDFDAYAEAMSRRLSEVDIKSKFSELKHSANLLKMIAEAGPEEDIDQIFNKHMTPELANAIDSSKPLYKMVSEAGLNQSAMKNIRAEQMLASKRQSIQESSRGNIARDVNSIVLGPSKKKLSNHYLTLDSQNKLSDKHESFEAFLLDQGVGASIYNNAGKQQGKEVPGSKGSGQYEGQSMGNIQPDNNSFSFIKQIDENASVMHNSQAGGMSADLHMFLMQNLREIMEVKDILRDGIGYGALESRDNLKTSRENDPSAIFVQNSGEDQFEQKLQEGQMERLVNKVKTLNEKLKKYEQESVETKRMTQAMKKCLRIGKVKMSDLIGVEVDISGLTLEHLYSHYSFQQKYIYVYTTHLSICNDAAVAGEQEQKFHYSEIEQVYFLEKPRSTFFMLKLLDKESDKSWGQDSIKESFKAGSQIKTRTLDTLSHFYFLEIEDQSEMAAWDLAFFIVNFKIISGHLSFSVNKNDFLTMMKALVQKYIATYGETSRPLSDLGASGAKLLGLNNSPPLSRMGSTTSEQASEKLGILDILNRKRMNGNPNVGNVQLPAFVKKRSDDGEKPEIKEEPSNPANRKVFQKQKSLPLRGMSAEDDLSSVEEGNSMSEENAEDSPDAREEKNKAHFIKALSKGPTLELDDDVFSRYLGTMAEGMVLLKHGKWGKSHDRLVRLSDDYAAIQWTHPLKPNKRKGVIDISTVYSVLIGKKSMYFSKKNMSPSELELCFSIVGKARSLHLQATNLQSRNYFIEALEYILKERNQLKKIAEQNNRARKAS